jgi:hypothetical protein
MDQDSSVLKLPRPEWSNPPNRRRGIRRKDKRLRAFNKNTFGEVLVAEKEHEMKTKVLLAVIALSYAPLGVAGNKADYPTEKVAAFVIEKLDVTSLPSAFRPKKEKGKKTFADYGFTAQTVGENEALIEAAGGMRRLAIKVLDQKSSGIFVCVAEPGENGGPAKTQTVLVLKRNDPSALLKGRESFREFDACPVIGGSDSTASSYGD